MARYPITSLTYSTKSDKERKAYKNIFEDYLSIQSSLISIGLDFFTYGNAFCSLYIPFKRKLFCKSCKTKSDADDVDYKFELRGLRFYGRCPNCKRAVDFVPKDEMMKIPEKFKIVKYYPGDIEIDYNNTSGKTRYLYNVPKETKDAIKKGSKFHVNATELIYLKAIEKNTQIIFNNDRLFHFKRDSISGPNMKWGMPLILPALKKAFYLQILQKAQEAIAIQHITPLTTMFPQAANGTNPFETLNLANWKTRLEGTIKTWKRTLTILLYFHFQLVFSICLEKAED
jgi:hypothetical protein